MRKLHVSTNCHHHKLFWFSTSVPPLILCYFRPSFRAGKFPAFALFFSKCKWMPMVGLKFHCDGYLYLELCVHEYSCRGWILHFRPILALSFVTNIIQNELTDSRFQCFFYRRKLFCTVRMVVPVWKGACCITRAIYFEKQWNLPPKIAEDWQIDMKVNVLSCTSTQLHTRMPNPVGKAF